MTTNTLDTVRDEKLKELVVRIAEFNACQERDGKSAIDFGVKGGELEKSRAPRNLASDGSFYAISEAVGKAADAVFATTDALQPLNPTPDPTRFFGTPEGEACPLHGTWKLLFTTAADASFSANSTRGDAQASNVVDGVAGTVTNVIDFSSRADGRPASLEQLQVCIKAVPERQSRVNLEFKFVRAKISRFFGIPIYRIPLLNGRRLTLKFFVPAPALTKILFAFRKDKTPPNPYFDVLYLDEELRIHRTGEGNLFVQTRPNSHYAKALLSS